MTWPIGKLRGGGQVGVITMFSCIHLRTFNRYLSVSHGPSRSLAVVLDAKCPWVKKFAPNSNHDA